MKQSLGCFLSLLNWFFCTCSCPVTSFLLIVAKVISVFKMQSLRGAVGYNPPMVLYCSIWVIFSCYTTHFYSCSLCFFVFLDCTQPLSSSRLGSSSSDGNIFSHNLLLTWQAYSRPLDLRSKRSFITTL